MGLGWGIRIILSKTAKEIIVLSSHQVWNGGGY